MHVYVLMAFRPYENGCEVLGVYSTLEKAQTAEAKVPDKELILTIRRYEVD